MTLLRKRVQVQPWRVAVRNTSAEESNAQDATRFWTLQAVSKCIVAALRIWRGIFSSTSARGVLESILRRQGRPRDVYRRHSRLSHGPANKQAEHSARPPIRCALHQLAHDSAEHNMNKTTSYEAAKIEGFMTSNAAHMNVSALGSLSPASSWSVHHSGLVLESPGSFRVPDTSFPAHPTICPSSPSRLFSITTIVNDHSPYSLGLHFPQPSERDQPKFGTGTIRFHAFRTLHQPSDTYRPRLHTLTTSTTCDR